MMQLLKSQNRKNEADKLHDELYELLGIKKSLDE